MTILSTSCGDDDTKAEEAQKKCKNLISVFTSRFEICFPDYPEEVVAFKKTMESTMDCKKAIDVKDSYNTCIDMTTVLSCDNFLSLSLPSSCQNVITLEK